MYSSSTTSYVGLFIVGTVVASSTVRFIHVPPSRRWTAFLVAPLGAEEGDDN